MGQYLFCENQSDQMTQPLKLYTYDLETLINFFSFTGKFYGDNRIFTFEISDRKNQRSELLAHLSLLQNMGVSMVGYNNLQFDYSFLHELLGSPHTFTFQKAYDLCQQIIGGQQYGNNFNSVRVSDRAIPQIDLMKVNHFDNKNKRCRLKDLEFAMRLHSVEDLPIKLGVPLNHDQMDDVLKYNAYDVYATENFLTKCMKHIEVRKELLDTGVLSGDVMNFSDVKIGTEFFIKRLGRSTCYISGSTPKQTVRAEVRFKDVILPKIYYRTEPFQEVLEWFKNQTVYPQSELETPKLESKLAGLQFYFGVGGLHASVEGRKFTSSDTHAIIDVDVSGMYPAISIANKFFPQHLGEKFMEHYQQLQRDRANYKKGSTMNFILKLAMNGIFGNSDNAYSCFYDPKYAKETTINGQLQLLQLVEHFSLIPGLEIIQANTDGVTVLIRRDLMYLLELWKTDWETQTSLKLEQCEYKEMWIRDVNNYLCRDTKGKIKAKGAYWYPVDESDYWGGSGSQWNKDYSMMVVQKVTEQSLLNGWNPDALIRLMSDPFDFMMRYKVPSGAAVYIGDKEMDKTVRYYVSTAGEPMKKVSKPKGAIGAWKRANSLTDSYFNQIMKEIPEGTWDVRIHTKKKSKYEQVSTNIENGRLVKCCNKASDFSWFDVDFEYYVNEVNKLLIS